MSTSTAVTCAVWVLTGAHNVQAGINVWTSHGPQVWGAASTLAVDPLTPSTLYAGGDYGVFKSTVAGGTWTAFNPGLTGGVNAFAIDPLTPTVYAGTDAGVYDIEQVAAVPCVGDCSGTLTVTVNDVITLVNIALGTAQPSACPQGVPSGAAVDITLILQAVNNALNGCGHSALLPAAASNNE